MTDLQALGSANAGFGADLYQKLAAGNPDGNVFFSPISVLFALALTLLGAKDKTESEIKSVLNLEKFPKDKLHPLFGELLAHFQDAKGNYTLDIANKLYGEKSSYFLPQFAKECRQFYGTGLEAVDFKNKADECASLINKWAEDKTHHKIKNLIPKGVLNELTKLVLVNAIYFKSNWITSFNKKYTKPEKFFTSKKKFHDAPFMHFPKISLKYNYNNELKCQILELPYVGESFSFVVILPDLDKTNLNKVEKQITGDILSEISKNSQTKDVRVWLPKFKLEIESDVLGSLKQLGINRLFSGNADLSKINGKKDLYISNLLHKAFIEVNEEGSEAAAATAVIVAVKSSLKKPQAEPTVFRADHPFIFLIKDNKSGAVLFMGKLKKP